MKRLLPFLEFIANGIWIIFMAIFVVLGIVGVLAAGRYISSSIYHQ